MTVPGLAASAAPSGQDEHREQRLAALVARLHEVAGQIRTAGDWDKCLRAAARLHGESWANVLLISSRIADATVVKGYQAWQADGRQVSREEKGIEIFSGAQRKEPGRHDDGGEDGHRSWRAARRVAYVWDVSQTSGRPVPLAPAVPVPPAEAPGELWDCLCWMARREGFAVEREDGCPGDGVTFWAARRIRVLPGLPAGQAAWALAHQLGHVLVHNTVTYPPGSATSGCQGVRRAEADSVAFIIAVRYGIPAGHVFSSPQTWAGRDPRAQPAAAILAAGERITTAAAKIARLVDQRLAETGLTARPAAEATATAAATSSRRSPPRRRTPYPRPREHRAWVRTRASPRSSVTPSSSTPASSPVAGFRPTSPDAASARPPRTSGTSDTPRPAGPRSPATCVLSATTTTRSRPPGWPTSPPAETSSTTSGTGSCSLSATGTATWPASPAVPARGLMCRST